MRFSGHSSLPPGRALFHTSWLPGVIPYLQIAHRLRYVGGRPAVVNVISSPFRMIHERQLISASSADNRLISHQIISPLKYPQLLLHKLSAFSAFGLSRCRVLSHSKYAVRFPQRWLYQIPILLSGKRSEIRSSTWRMAQGFPFARRSQQVG